MSLVSFDESVFSHELMKILAFTSLSFSFIEVFSSLMAFSFFSQFDAFSKSYLSLMVFFSSFLA